MKSTSEPNSRTRSTRRLAAFVILISALGVLPAQLTSPSVGGDAVRMTAEPCVETGQADVCDDSSEIATPPDNAPEAPFGEGALGDIAAPGYNGGGDEHGRGGGGRR